MSALSLLPGLPRGNALASLAAPRANPVVDWLCGGTVQQQLARHRAARARLPEEEAAGKEADREKAMARARAASEERDRDDDRRRAEMDAWLDDDGNARRLEEQGMSAPCLREWRDAEKLLSLVNGEPTSLTYDDLCELRLSAYEESVDEYLEYSPEDGRLFLGSHWNSEDYHVLNPDGTLTNWGPIEAAIHLWMCDPEDVYADNEPPDDVEGQTDLANQIFQTLHDEGEEGGARWARFCDWLRNKKRWFLAPGLYCLPPEVMQRMVEREVARRNQPTTPSSEKGE